MNKHFKHRVSKILVLLMFLTLFPAGAMAAADEPDIPLEQAIQNVKQYFSIPDEYTVFSSSYRSSEDKQIWLLTWEAADDQGGRFNAQVDAGTGIILSMNTWKPGEIESSIPTVSIDQARNTGEQLLKNLLPERFSCLQAIPSNEVISVNSGGNGEYTLKWQRIAHNIPVDNEGATIRINYTSGQVTFYRLTWSDYIIPDPSNLISVQEARQSFEANNMLELQYLLQENVFAESEQEAQVKLVYRIHHPSNGVIDAFTAEPVVLHNTIYYDRNSIPGGMGASEKSMEEMPLSPEEQKEVERNLNLLSQDEAAVTVKKWVSIPSQLKLTEANLYRDHGNPDLQIWNLSWSPASEDSSNYPSYINARVNADNGELISFYQALPESDLKASLTQDKAQQIADKFLKKIQPERSRELRLESDSFDIIKPIPLENDTLPDNWYFHYERMVNGIPCPDNGIDISVDSRTGTIDSYYLNWADISFPSAEKTMGMEKAGEVFLTSQPLTLQYIKDYNAPQKYDKAEWQFRLIYRPEAELPELESDMIDAVTGESLRWDGTPLTRDPQPCVFTDIKGHFAEKEISLLGQAGIMCEYETAFHPHEEINMITFLRAMLMANNTYRADELNDEEIIQRAKDNEWLQEDIAADTILTRDMLAKLMVRMLDIEYIAQMPAPALQAPYQDYASLNPDLKGYAALTWGLELIQGDGQNFNAAHKISRGEAALVLVRTLQIDK